MFLGRVGRWIGRGGRRRIEWGRWRRGRGRVEVVGGGSGGLGRGGFQSIDVVCYLGVENGSGSFGGPNLGFERMEGVRVLVEDCRRRGFGVGMRVVPLDGRTGFVGRHSQQD